MGGSDESRPRELRTARDAASTAGARAPRILLVEDDYFVALELEHELSDAGFDVIGIATTAEEAVKIGRSESPDLAIMDVRLDGRRDGVDAAIELFKVAGIRSIFTTAHGDAETRRRAAEAHPLGWMQKPYAPDAVIALLNSVLGAGN